MSTGTDSPDYRYLLMLTGASVILQTLASIVSTFPFFQFFAYAPLLGLYFYLFSLSRKLSVGAAGLIFAAFIIPAFIKFLVFDLNALGFAASISPAIVFVLWYYSGTVLNALKGLYFLVFWLGVEYIFISLENPIFVHLPGSSFRLWGESMVYVKYTGFQGTTLWLLVTNILFARCFFKTDGRLMDHLRRGPFITASLAGVLPMAISMFAFRGSPEGDLTEFFNNPSEYMAKFNYDPFYTLYLDYGEYLGKLSFWLSFIILLSIVVKQLLRLWK